MLRTNIPVLLILLLGCLAGCRDQPDEKPLPDYQFPYQLDFPARTMLMPDALEEVSGISWLPTGEFACVQDEEGFIMIFDTVSNEINRTLKFGSKSDYEDIAVVGRDAYVLESDGVIRAIRNFDEEAFRRDKYKFPLSGNYNTEGICYDKSNNRLLIASKNAGNIENAKSRRRQIFEFRLTDTTYNTKPVFTIGFDDVRSYFKQTGDTLGLKAVETSGPMMVFKPSAIQVHPISQHIYLLSAYPPMVAVLHHYTGELLYTAMLPPDIHPQPEGLTFGTNASICIASEGKNNRGRICCFKKESSRKL